MKRLIWMLMVSLLVFGLAPRLWSFAGDNIEALKKQIAKNPNDAEAHYSLGVAYDILKDGANAVLHMAEAEKLLEKFGDDFSILLANSRKLLREYQARYGFKAEDFAKSPQSSSESPRPPLQGGDEQGGGQDKTPLITAATGFILNSSGYVITNAHVVRGANRITVRFVNGEKTEAAITMKDEANDIAFLKPQNLPKSRIVNIAVGNPADMKLGDKVFTIGFPMSSILGSQPGYSSGEISALAGIGGDPGKFRISVPIQHGNSGGPLFNEKGELVGVVSASLDTANTAAIFQSAPQNVNFAVKSGFVQNLLSSLPDTLVAPTDIVVVPNDAGSLANFKERVQGNIVLLKAEY